MAGLFRKVHAVGLLGAGMLFLMPTIPLGVNGQQIIVQSGAPTASVKITGDNQYGSTTRQTLNTPSQSTDDSGYWWKGWISISSFSGSSGGGALLGTTRCYVPADQASNWVTCQAD